jgi:hypothetical protein
MLKVLFVRHCRYLANYGEESGLGRIAVRMDRMEETKQQDQRSLSTTRHAEQRRCKIKQYALFFDATLIEFFGIALIS